MHKLCRIRPVLVSFSVTLAFLFLCSLPNRQHPHPLAGTDHAYARNHSHSHTAAARWSSSSPPLQGNTLHRNGTVGVHRYWDFGEPCRAFPATEDMVVVMKTGATEAYEKLPTQLLTGLQCVSDLLIFSDLEQQMGKYHIYNVLDRVQEDMITTSNRQEFRLYQIQQACPVSQRECTRGVAGGWDLDKYKFTNMVVRAWEMRPGRKWYVFVEADTYVVWSNLVGWLATTEMDPSEDVYVGSVAYLGDMPFAHGGSGYVISGTLLAKIVAYLGRRRPSLDSDGDGDDGDGVADRFDRMAMDICCGDALLARVIGELGVSVRDATPMFSNERPGTVPFGRRGWCEPLVTLHHLDAEEVSTMWQYEQTRRRTRTGGQVLRIRDLYRDYVASRMVRRREGWDNGAEERCWGQGEGETVVERLAYGSAEACGRACAVQGLEVEEEEEYGALRGDRERDEFVERRYRESWEGGGEKRAEGRCFQWRWKGGVCCTSDGFRLGYPVHGGGKDVVVSGWFLDGIGRWIEEAGGCDEGDGWVKTECRGEWC